MTRQPKAADRAERELPCVGQSLLRVGGSRRQRRGLLWRNLVIL